MNLVSLTYPLVAALLVGCGSSSGEAVDASSIDTRVIANTRCTILYNTLVCDRYEMQLGGRTVAYAVPVGEAPATGWPAVLFYQGSFIAGAGAFTGAFSAPYGGYELTATVHALLDGGYAVIAPNALNNGNSYWQTNIPPYATNWSGCDDDQLVDQLLAAMSAGTLGPINMAKLHAMGISSGGFMTSRMAVSYPGTFKSLAIVAASYATCGPTCTVPTTLPADHPPTVFVHGDSDTTVPISTMYPYRDQLITDGRAVEAIVSINKGHEWLPEGKTAIPAWFDAH